MNCELDSAAPWDEKLCVGDWEGTCSLTVAAKCEPFWIASGQLRAIRLLCGRQFRRLSLRNCGLDGRQFEFRQEQEILLFFLYKNVQTGPENYPASCTMGTGARRPRPAADIGYCPG